VSSLSPMRTDQELLAAYAATGDESAFAELVSRHGRMVYRTCLRSLGSEHDAEEAAQAVFLVLVQKRRALRSEGELAAWLHRVAKNAAHLAIRSRARRSRHEAEAAMVRPVASADGAVGARHAAPLQDLDRELDALPAAQRQAVVLRYLEGLPQEEAARAAGCPQGTLARRAQLGLERLRERLCQRGRVLSATALAGLLGAEAAAAAPASLLPSILAVSKLAAVGAAAGAAGTVGAVGAQHAMPVQLAEGVIRMMFWAKARLMAAVVAGALAVGSVGGTVAGTMLAGEPAAKPPAAAAEKPPVTAEKPVATAEKPPATAEAVNGLKLTISADKPEAKAGDDVKIAASMENVSAEALRVFLYWSDVSWELVAPDGESLQYVPYRGPMPGIAPPNDLSAFPEIAAGAKRACGANGLAGNPPTVGVGGEPRFTKVCLLKPGVYKLTAVYTNGTDTLWTKDLKGQQPVPGKVWKGTVRSNTLELKLGGEFKAPANVGPWPVGGIPGVTPPQKGQQPPAGAPDEATARRLVLEHRAKVVGKDNVRAAHIRNVDGTGDRWMVEYDPHVETMPPDVYFVDKKTGVVSKSRPGR
jgi:RNA polymerase sigma factor (sigma-70 family)